MLIDKIIERIENEKNYIENIPNEIDNAKKETPIVQEMSKQAKIMKSFLNCDCKYYPLNSEDNDIICGYLESLQRSKDGSFIPIIVDISDNLLDAVIMNAVIDSDDDSESDIICGYLESLQRSKDGSFIPIIVDISDNLLDAVIMNAVIDSDDDSESIMDLGIRENKKRDEFFKNGIIDFETSEVIERYRKNMISKDFSAGKELLDEMIENNREYFGGYELEKDELEVRTFLLEKSY